MTEDQAKRFIDPQNSPAAIGADRRSAFLRLGVSKQNNNAAPLGQWLERQGDGVLRPGSRSDPAVKAVHLHRHAALPELSQALSLLPQRCQRHSLFGLHLSESPRRLHTSPDGEMLQFKAETAQRLPQSIWK